MSGDKTIDPAKPAAVRIRDNQRRSRARRKEYLEDMQKKLQDYERRGVEATREMQQAARSVAVENQRLRLLLKRHGVQDDEVKLFLQSFQDQQDTNGALLSEQTPPLPTPPIQESGLGLLSQAATTPLMALAPRNGGLMKWTSQASQNYEARATVSSSCKPPGCGSPQNGPSPTQVTLSAVTGKLSCAPLQDNVQDCCGGRTTCTMPSAQTEVQSPSTAGPSPCTTTSSGQKQAESPDDVDADADPFSPHEMSCTAAARIIAQMHGHGDNDLAKAALGCNGQEECTVKNTTLFQVLELRQDI